MSNTIQIMGGLGNQLFQVFVLLSYSISNKLAFHFEITESSRIDRPFYWNNFLKSLKPFLKQIIQLPLYYDPEFNYNKIPLFNRPFKLYGYFQSYKYFDKNKHIIEKLIKLKNQQENLKNDYEFSNIISIHFRIGDYINIQKHHPLLPIEYYKKALHKLLTKTNKNNWRVLYFCEEQDIKHVEKKVSILKLEFSNLIFEKINSKYADWEQMLIMSLCQHNIIANSSFSWWGAYFNKNNNKLVYYPSKYFGPAEGDKNLNDMFPDDWTKINNI